MNESRARGKGGFWVGKTKTFIFTVDLTTKNTQSSWRNACLLITKGKSLSGVCQNQDFQEPLTTSYIREGEDTVKYSGVLSCLDLRNEDWSERLIMREKWENYIWISKRSKNCNRNRKHTNLRILKHLIILANFFLLYMRWAWQCNVY